MMAENKDTASCPDKGSEDLAEKMAELNIDPVKSAVRFVASVRTEAGKESEAAIIFKSKGDNEEPAKVQCTVDCRLKSLLDGSTPACQVEVVKGFKLLVKFTPTARGRHDLTVSVNGQEIEGSPFRVLVPPNIGQLTTPVKIIKGLSDAMGVAVNSVGNIIVAECNYLWMFDPNGKELNKVNVMKYGSWDMRESVLDVCVDCSDDSVYLAGGLLVKVDSDLSMLKQTSGGEQGFRSVMVKGEEVVACTREYRGDHIQVYDKDLNRLRTLAYDMGPICGLSCDHDGDIWVTDFPNKRVCIVNSKTGKVGYSMRGLGSAYDSFDGPHGICRYGGLVFVSDINDHFIAVFTIQGRFVAKFSKRGSAEGAVFCPRGLCTDEDGFVYVCDPRNGRVQVF